MDEKIQGQTKSEGAKEMKFFDGLVNGLAAAFGVDPFKLGFQAGYKRAVKDLEHCAKKRGIK